jgi:acyl transferase domain-containing protein
VDDTHNFLKSRGLSGHHQTILPTGEPALVADVDSGFNSSASGSEGGDPESLTPRFKLFVFSSVDPAGLQRNATALARQIRDTLPKEEQDEPGIKPAETETDVDAKFLEDLVYTLATRRSLFDQRAFVVARSSKDLQEQLSKPLPKTRRGAINSNIFFTFTGQGAQWASMGAALRARAPFRQSLSRAEAQLASLGCKWSLIDELIATKDTSRIDEPYLSQPLCTALQLALVDLAAEWKILPRAVVGHSSGEIAAAYAAGYLSHEDAMTVAYWRGVLSADVNNRLQGKTGAMMAVGLSEMDVQPYLDKVPLRTVVVACINSPRSQSWRPSYKKQVSSLASCASRLRTIRHTCLQSPTTT